MNRLKPKYRAVLERWTDRDRFPDDDALRTDLYDLLMTVGAARSETEFNDPSRLTESQRRAFALVDFGNSVPTGGLVVGVLVNQPEILEHCKAVEAELSPASRRLLGRIFGESGQVRSIPDPDRRFAWTEANEARAAALDDLMASDAGERLREEIMVIALRHLARHPDEFFRT